MRVTILLLFFLLLQICRADFSCFWVNSTESNVCSGFGVCTSQDVCSCYTGYTGLNCNMTDCSWTLTSLGAPKPIIDAFIDSLDNVIMRVTLFKKYHVLHSLNLVEPLQCSEAKPIDQTPQWTIMEDTSCYTKYQWNRTLQEHIQDNNVTKVFSDGDVFQAQATIFSTYISDGCSMTTFKTPFNINVFLLGISTAMVQSSDVAVGTLKQNRIRVLTDGRLELLASLSLSTSGRLSNFSFISSTQQGLSLIISSNVQNSDCGSNSQGKCVYDLQILSTSALDDYSGSHKFGAILTVPDTNQVVNINLVFNLQYTSPTPPSISNVNITTVSSFYDSGFTTKKTVFTSLEEAWVLTEIVQQISVPTRALTVRNSYLCCMKNRGAMPVYNPSSGKMGCTTQTDDMSIWEQLVGNENTLSTRYNTKIQKLAFLDNKIGFSFSLLPLIGEDRLCYVHVESFLKAKARSGSGRMIKDAGVDRVISFSPLQVLLGNQNTPKNDLVTSSLASKTFKVGSSLLLVWMAIFILL